MTMFHRVPLLSFYRCVVYKLESRHGTYRDTHVYVQHERELSRLPLASTSEVYANSVSDHELSRYDTTSDKSLSAINALILISCCCDVNHFSRVYRSATAYYSNDDDVIRLRMTTDHRGNVHWT